MTDPPAAIAGLDLPPPWPQPLLSHIDEHNRATDARIVVLDDDPLGGQCVHDVPVLTTWETAALATAIDRSPAFLLLTNTRALSRAGALQRAREMAVALHQAERASGRPVTTIWRSDSTLRGHFWWEMRAFEAAFRNGDAPEPVYVFLPYFGEGGRYTASDTQYVLHDGRLIPVAETEFARDPAFAFTHSHLPSWLEAHSGGRFLASDVVCITLADTRSGGPDRVAAVLREAPGGSAVIVNAMTDADLDVFVAALKQVEAEGRRFLCSGAAPFVRARLGQEPRPLLTAAAIGLVEGAGGLTIVGSYVDKTNAQLAVVRAGTLASDIEIDLEALSAPPSAAAEVRRIGALVSRHLAQGDDVVLHTSRQYKAGAADVIAEALAAIVAALEVRPRYILAKGGATAGRLATAALGIKQAMVLGQLMPGVPVWRLGEESRWPGLPLVIFPGNVGTEESLEKALRLLRRS